MVRQPTRRQFGRAAGIAGAFTILKAGSARTYAANEKLNVAAIGVGGRGAADIRQVSSENIVALCDVDSKRAAGSFRAFPDARKFVDYRVMLAEMETKIDAVVVATPDHHHFSASMAAIRLGKHVYCEKPLTHSIWEARQLTLAARKAGVATQMGNQAQASEATRQIQELVMNNAIGPVSEAYIWTDRPSRGLFGEYWPQGVTRPADTPAAPDSLSWDLWLGPAPARPYHPSYAPFAWRGWWDFGTGALGDIGCHYFDPVFRALKLGSPNSVEAVSTRVNNETYPLGSVVTYQFPARENMPEVKLVWHDGGLRPARPAILSEGVKMGDNGIMLVGDEGVILTDWNSPWKVFPEARANALGAPAKTFARSPGHHQEWIEACKGGDAAGSNFDWAGPLTEAVLLGNVALRPELRTDLTQRKLLWDSEKLEFSNHAAANQFLKRDYRDGWSAEV